MKEINKLDKKIIVRCISIILALCLLTGCGANSSKTGIGSSGDNSSAPTEIRETQTLTEEIPGKDATYRTETVYDYYDDQYTTNAGEWNIKGGTQHTVQNLSNYNFDEEKYNNATYSGGSNVRSESFIRGMGGTDYHATEGWNLSQATRSLDNGYLKELNVTSKRYWSEGTTSELSDLYDYASNLVLWGVLPQQSFKDGNSNPTSLQFAAPNALELISKSWINTLTKSSVRNQLKLTLLGNEYRVNFQNNNGNYEFSGYDDVTLKAFRQNWCVSRFGTIDKLNKLCGTKYKSFNEVYPTENEPILFYEFWLFQRETFRQLMTGVMNKVNNSYSDINWGYAAIASNNDPLGNHLYLEMDYSSQNLYLNWFSNFYQYSFQLDNLTAWSKTAPVVITELGFRNGLTDESKATAARRYKQNLNLLYMRPRVVGSYIFNYTCSAPDIVTNDDTWGMVTPDRTKYPSFEAVAQVYSDFKYMDKYYNGASNTPLVAVTNQSVTERLSGQKFISSNLASILYAQGVPIQVVPSDDSTRFDSLEETKLIFNDHYLYQNPDGSNDVGKSLENYMSNGNRILRTVNTVPKSIYGKNNYFTATNSKQLDNKYDNLIVNAVSTADQSNSWKVLGNFIHGDFIDGKVAVTKNKIDENAVRILEVQGFDNAGIIDPTWNVETQMVYKNGEMYLCVVNTSDKPIDKLDVTIGVNSKVLCNLTPRLIRGDSSVSVYRPERANVPSYVEKVDDAKVQFGTLTIKNLDTYAYIYVGKAVQ